MRFKKTKKNKQYITVISNKLLFQFWGVQQVNIFMTAFVDHLKWTAENSSWLTYRSDDCEVW